MATATLQTDDNNDLFLDSLGNLVVITGIAAVLQDARAETLLRLGEDVYDVRKGVDYFGSIFSPQPNFDDARQSIINAIESSPDVVRVDEIQISVSGDSFEYAAKAMSTYGPLTVKNS